MRTSIRLLVLLIGIVIVVSCQPQTQDQTNQSQPNKPNSSLALQQLQNAEYHIESTTDDRFQLTDGEYRKKILPDSASERIVRLSHHVAGNLDNTDGEDAAVILIEEPGGSGTFYYLAVVVNRDGNPDNVATTFLGDRVKVKALDIEEEEIVVHMLTRGADKSMASEPTLEVTQKYRLEANKLVLVKE